MERTRFKTAEQESNATGTESRHAEKAVELGSVEEVLRFDAAHVTPPPQLDDRVKQSLQAEPPGPRKSWWGKLFG